LKRVGKDGPKNSGSDAFCTFSPTQPNRLFISFTDAHQIWYVDVDQLSDKDSLTYQGEPYAGISSFGTVNVNDANTGTITGASNVTLDNLDEDGTVGRVATEAQLAAVRNEVAGTKDIDNKLRGFKRGADAGTASAMAMAGIPQVINPGENAIGASISAYKQQTAVAVGLKYAPKPNVVISLSGSADSRGGVGAATGVSLGIN